MKTLLAERRTHLRRLLRRERLIALTLVLVFVAAAGRAGIDAALLATLACSGLLVWVLHRTRRALDAARADVALLALAQDASEHDSMPLVVVRGLSQSPDRARTTQERDVSLPTRLAAAGAIVVAVLAFALLLGPGPRGDARRWTFLEDAPPSSLGFTATTPAAGPWAFEAHDAATGGRALVNHEGDPGSSPAVLVAPASDSRNVHVVTRCKTSVSCGVAFRFVDERTHRIARVDVLRRVVELVAVDHGISRVLASASAREPGHLAPDVWQEIAIEARGDVVVLSLNGREVARTVDPLPLPAGNVGLWVPAGARAYFDELFVHLLPASPQALEVVPILGRAQSS